MQKSRTLLSRSNSALAVLLAVSLTAIALPARSLAAGPGFRTQNLLTEHYEKHGREFGAISRDQYLRLAQQLRDARVGRNILELQRTGGGFARFDLKHGYFGAYSADGSILTFFIPNDGIRYFERQGRAGARNRVP